MCQNPLIFKGISGIKKKKKKKLNSTVLDLLKKVEITVVDLLTVGRPDLWSDT